MNVLLDTLFNGLAIGSVLMLAALGLAVVFGLMGVINMAHGELMMLGAYTTYVVQNLLKNGPLEGLFPVYILLSIPLAFLVSGLAGLLLEKTVIRRLYGRPLETLLATWGVSLILQQFVRSVSSAFFIGLVVAVALGLLAPRLLPAAWWRQRWSPLLGVGSWVGASAIGIMMMIFLVMIAFMMSDALEGAWGAFKTTLFFTVGIIGLIAANLLFPQMMPGSGFILYGAAFFAFATLFPKVEFLLFFILPVQVRFLAWIQAAGLVLLAFADFRLLPFFLLGYANYLIFAGLPALRGTALVIDATQRKRSFNAAKDPESAAFHTCAVCDRTDLSDPRMEFRVGHDGREYCADHLPE
ncbi:MAG: hypothetical protein WCH37_06295, partial [Synechococcaceae cyanobacterium ELA182]